MPKLCQVTTAFTFYPPNMFTVLTYLVKHGTVQVLLLPFDVSGHFYCGHDNKDLLVLMCLPGSLIGQVQRRSLQVLMRRLETSSSLLKPVRSARLPSSCGPRTTSQSATVPECP